MTSLVVRVPIDAPPEQVWQQLAVRYGDVHQWSGPIADSGMEAGHTEGRSGAVRSCTLGPDSPIGKGETFSETILQWDPARRFFAAGVDDGFYPMRKVVQEYWVDAGPNGGTVVTTQFHFDLSFPMGKGTRLVSRLRPQVVTSLLGLKHLVERGDAQRAQDAQFLRRTYPAVYRDNEVG
ncbi:MAG: SRPBCC family protein [Deltaproteobacteria bacterium]|nr:SRPBCC family protein [Deltaproteobacteria bacterium]